MPGAITSRGSPRRNNVMCIPHTRMDHRTSVAPYVGFCTKYHPSPSKSFKLRHSILVPFPDVYPERVRTRNPIRLLHARQELLTEFWSGRQYPTFHLSRVLAPVAGALISEISADGISLTFVGTTAQTSRITPRPFVNACQPVVFGAFGD